MDRRAEEDFTALVARVEPVLRRGLASAYGPAVGRECTADALAWAWAWQHWDRVRTMENPAGYLFRVGQSASRRYLRAGASSLWEAPSAWADAPDFQPELLPALRSLSDQQRTVVVMVEGYGYGQREVAALLGLSVSTVREHLRRAIDHLRIVMEVHDAR